MCVCVGGGGGGALPYKTNDFPPSPPPPPLSLFLLASSMTTESHVSRSRSPRNHEVVLNTSGSGGEGHSGGGRELVRHVVVDGVSAGSASAVRSPSDEYEANGDVDELDALLSPTEESEAPPHSIESRPPVVVSVSCGSSSSSVNNRFSSSSSVPSQTSREDAKSSSDDGILVSSLVGGNNDSENKNNKEKKDDVLSEKHVSSFVGGLSGNHDMSSGTDVSPLMERGGVGGEDSGGMNKSSSQDDSISDQNAIVSEIVSVTDDATVVPPPTANTANTTTVVVVNNNGHVIDGGCVDDGGDGVNSRNGHTIVKKRKEEKTVPSLSVVIRGASSSSSSSSLNASTDKSGKSKNVGRRQPDKSGNTSARRGVHRGSSFRVPLSAATMEQRRELMEKNVHLRQAVDSVEKAFALSLSSSTSDGGGGEMENEQQSRRKGQGDGGKGSVSTGLGGSISSMQKELLEKAVHHFLEAIRQESGNARNRVIVFAVVDEYMFRRQWKSKKSAVQWLSQSSVSALHKVLKQSLEHPFYCLDSDTEGEDISPVAVDTDTDTAVLDIASPLGLRRGKRDPKRNRDRRAVAGAKVGGTSLLAASDGNDESSALELADELEKGDERALELASSAGRETSDSETGGMSTSTSMVSDHVDSSVCIKELNAKGGEDSISNIVVEKRDKGGKDKGTSKRVRGEDGNLSSKTNSSSSLGVSKMKGGGSVLEYGDGRANVAMDSDWEVRDTRRYHSAQASRVSDVEDVENAGGTASYIPPPSAPLLMVRHVAPVQSAQSGIDGGDENDGEDIEDHAEILSAGSPSDNMNEDEAPSAG